MADAQTEHTVSVIIPVYRPMSALAAVVGELAPFTEARVTPAGRPYVVHEVILVNDCGPEGSDAAVRELADQHDWVRPLWLSRNFGQHAATLAGIAASGGDWVVTMDEDGQHDPAYIGALLDTAMAQQADLVYARPSNAPPHGFLRNVTSRGSKVLVGRFAPAARVADFHSYRLALGEVARSVAAYAGPGIYLDIAFSWVARRVSTCSVPLRDEGGRPSGYTWHGLASHFWRLALSAGTAPLRWVSGIGVLALVSAAVLGVMLLAGRALGYWDAPGWTSTMVLLMLATGAILFALGLIAEYLGMAVNMAMGKPLYLLVRDPRIGPLGRDGD